MQLTSKMPLPTPSITRHRALWISVISLTLLLIAALDQVTGVLPVHHFYYLPIILAAIRFRKPPEALALAACTPSFSTVS